MRRPQVLTPVVVTAAICLGVALLAADGAEAKKRAKGGRAKRASPVLVETLPDGMTFLHVHTPGSGRVSLRFAIRAGGFDDPEDHAGLAHLLEHLVFHGTYESPEGELFDEARARGAYINAMTGPEWTIYVLDGHADTFLPLAHLYLRTVTGPALRFSKLERENAVVLAEQELRNAHSILWATDQLVFPSENRGRNVIGTEASRATITVDDLEAFYLRHYVPANTVAVVVGDLEPAQAKAMLDAGVLWPPSPPPEPVTDRAPPNVPSEAKGLSWTTATALGYQATGMSLRDCTDAALLLELEAYRRVRLTEAIAQAVHGFCNTTRGETFLVLVAFGTNGLASQLPGALDKAFLKLRDGKIDKGDLRVVGNRARARLSTLKGDPAELATALAATAAGADDIDAALGVLLSPPALDSGRIQKGLKKAVRRERRFLVHFSPFEG